MINRTEALYGEGDGGKTGGQTIRDHLGAGLGLDRYLHLGRWNRDEPYTFDDVAAMSAEQRAGLHAVGGHPLNFEFDALFPDRLKKEIIVLREPAARIVSHYNFTSTMRERRGEPPLDLEAFITEHANFQTRAILTRFGLRHPMKPLSDALHRLTRCAFVGRTVDLDDTPPDPALIRKIPREIFEQYPFVPMSCDAHSTSAPAG